MAVQLNHTIVHATDKHASAEFLAHILGLEVSPPFGPFLPVVTDNEVALDYYENHDKPVTSQHYAFLVTEEEFDAMMERIKAADVTYYADPSHSRPGTTNTYFGGRGAYFDDPDGHNMEIMTRPYGSRADS
ncbi:VOC family protein [Streptomyces sp. NPDC048604]|uniref:VOC family protein n=1 Tax=Streptomyces sp. NPDC048604 TaxID=3365578 RepID=UPI003712C29D